MASNLFYGTIKVGAVGANVAAGQRAGNVHLTQTGQADGSNLPKVDSSRMTAFQASQKSLTAAIPTNDLTVKQKLRDYGEPICLFGEGPYDRRERLREIISTRGAMGPDGITPASKGECAELFYTEGTEWLRNHRIKIAKYSIPRAMARLKQQKQDYIREDPLDYERKFESHMAYIEQSVHTQLSQVGDSRPLTCGRFSPDASLFATSSWSGAVKVWNVATGQLKKAFSEQENRGNRALSVAFHPSTSSKISLASTCSDGMISFHSLEDGTTTKLEGHEDRVNNGQFHPCGDYYLSTSDDTTWRLWDVETQKEILLQEGHAKATYALDIQHDGSLVAVSDLTGTVRIWDLRSGRSIMPLTAHVKEVLSVAFSPNGYNLATGSKDNTVRVWDLRKRRCTQNILAHSKLVSDIRYEPVHGRFLVTSSYDGTAKIWSTLNYECKKTMVAHESRVDAVDVCMRDNRLLFGTVSADRTFKFWGAKGEYDHIKASIEV